jgi:hypothetical protein
MDKFFKKFLFFSIFNVLSICFFYIYHNLLTLDKFILMGLFIFCFGLGCVGVFLKNQYTIYWFKILLRGYFFYIVIISIGDIEYNHIKNIPWPSQSFLETQLFILTLPLIPLMYLLGKTDNWFLKQEHPNKKYLSLFALCLILGITITTFSNYIEITFIKMMCIVILVFSVIGIKKQLIFLIRFGAFFCFFYCFLMIADIDILGTFNAFLFIFLSLNLIYSFTLASRRSFIFEFLLASFFFLLI